MGMAAGTSESTEKRRKMTLSGSKEPLEMSTTNMAQMEFLEGRSLCRDDWKVVKVGHWQGSSYRVGLCVQLLELQQGRGGDLFCPQSWGILVQSAVRSVYPWVFAASLDFFFWELAKFMVLVAWADMADIIGIAS